MVDIHAKSPMVRVAVAEGFIKLRKETLKMIAEGKVEKGDVYSVSQVAGILAAKNTPRIIPLCHPIPIEKVDVSFELSEDRLYVRASVKSTAKTGVEMEALTAVSTALLSVWDMVKKYEKDENGQYPYTQIGGIRVLEKTKRMVKLED